MNPEKNEFYNSAMVSKTCIHSVDEDPYSKLFIPREKCDCGHSEWVESTMVLFNGFPVKKVHRCKECNELRLADHIGMKETEE